MAKNGILGRGVFQAPWLGPNGEMVLVSINSRHEKHEELTVTHGANRIDVGEAMEARLDAADPQNEAKPRALVLVR
jgi:hypothetical protein